MIARIEGKLINLDTDKALVQVGNIAYEVMLAGSAVSRLSGKIGSDIVLCTMEYYEGTLGGGNLIPRMVGFLNLAEREFFDIFTSVNGMGIKKALKAMCMPAESIAAAIANGDEKLLISLPNIGKKMASVIVAELQNKVSKFAAASEPERPRQQFDKFQIEALEILVAWGEKRQEALGLIDLACQKHPNIKTAEELVPLVYRIKQGAEA
jgi:Holliday junction DNA helicase RuvA